MRLVIGDVVIADSETDSRVKWLHVSVMPELSFPPDTIRARNLGYGLNISRPDRITHGVEIRVGWTFATYIEAEDHAMNHLLALSNGAAGILKFRNMLGNLFGFDNSVLTAAKLVKAFGVTNEFSYTFACGKPLMQFDCAFVILDSILAIGDNIVTFKIRR